MKKESQKRVISTVVWLGLLALIPVIGWLFAFIIAIVWATKYTKEFCMMQDYVRKIKEGKFDEEKIVFQDENLEELALDIYDVKDNIKKLVYEEVKSERLKTDLIVSASHDLKMPLDSILNEIETISKGDISEIEMKKRMDIIKLRAKRLTMLSNDLIEKSYISNSDMKIDLKKVDMFSLITKGLGEMENDIKKSEMSFKLNIKKQKIYANADGILLWRIIENLISDIFKHGKKKGRVYLGVDEDEKFVNICLQNELDKNFNMSSEEFCDKYLNREKGSSSLMVARSLTLLQRGEFEVKIEDGGFNVIIRLPIYK